MKCLRYFPNWKVKLPMAVCRGTPPDPKPVVEEGPGTELKALLKRIGITAKPGCKCNARAYEMNAMGCDWCEANIELISSWLQEEAAARKLPYVEAAGMALIHLAISRARKKMSSGVREGT